MVAQNEKLLKETYDNLINVALCVAPVPVVEGVISDQFMCYGTAADEEVYRFEGLKWMVERSKVELGDVKHGIKRYPKFRNIFSKGYSALIIEEVDVLIGEGADTISIRARLSTLCEYINDRWMIHHFHVSTPDANTQEGEAWPIEEWKRKNKELEALVAEKTADLVYKNRELEIEGSLGRIRAVAMSMNKTDDVLSICKVMFKELEVLGFKDVRNAVINFWDDDLQQLLDYDYSDFAGSNVSRIAYDSHPAFEKFQRHIRSSIDSFVELVISGNELETWKERRIKSGEYEDPRLGNNSALHYYFYSIGVGAIGISTFSSLSNENLVVLKRFRNVFDLAYRRYIDIQQAEAQAKEAKIELSLERIRAQVTSMQASSELLEIVVMMRQEFVNLGHEAHYFWYMRWLPDFYQKAMTSGDGTRIGMVMTLPRHMHGDVKLLSDWEKSNEPVIVYAMDADAAVDYIGKMISLGDFEIVDPNAPTLDDIRRIGGLTFVMARTTHGEIGFSLPGSVSNPSQEALATLVRFATVFDLAYKRFLDLQMKEEQSEKLKNEKERLEQTLAELKATQKQLIQSEKMASLGELTAGIAHEIQNPLNFVNNFSEVNTELLDELQQELSTGNTEEALLLAKDIKENELKINHHGKRADAIVKGMLQHSGANSGIKEQIDINSLANEYFRLSYHGLRAKDKSFTAVLTTNFDPSVGEIKVFGQDIGRVLINLFNNAFYSVNEKKKTLDDSYKPEVRVTTEKHDGQVYIKIKDNGTGIPEKLLSKIYQPFFTTKPTGEGTGLGLSLSYDIITKGHGGQMKVETKEGEGSEFKIQLPAS